MEMTMGTPDQINILFSKIDRINEGISGVKDSIAELRSDVKVLTSEMEHKSDKNEISREIQLHSMECGTRKTGPNPGLFTGTSPGNKAALISAIVAFLTMLTMFVQSKMQNDNTDNEHRRSHIAAPDK